MRSLKRIAAVIGCVGVVGMGSSCKKECTLTPLEGYEIKEYFDKKGKFSHCEYVKIDDSCPQGCDSHTKDKCGEYFHGTDTVIHLEGDFTAILHQCDRYADTSKVKQPDACPTGCINHTKSKCELFVHEEQNFLLANGKTIHLYPCDEWRDTLRVNADTINVDILNLSDLQANLARMEAIYKVDHNIAKVVIFNPLRVDAGGFPVITDFKNRVTVSNGKIIAEWRDNFICPPTNKIMLTYAKWEEMGKPKLGINPDNGYMYDINILEKSKFPDISVLNIVILPLELEYNSSQTLADVINQIQLNQQVPVGERPQVHVKCTGDFDVNNGGDIPNLETLVGYFESNWAIFVNGTGKIYPATDSISVQNGTLLERLGMMGLLKETTINGQRYYFVHDGASLSVIPSNTFVRTGSIFSSDGANFSRTGPNEIKINSKFNVQELTPLHGNWNTPIKLTPTADPSKPGGEWSVVGVNDWFLNNYNQGAGSAFFSNTPLILGHYTNTFTDYHTIEGLDISALNIDTLNNNYYTIKASNDKVGDPNLRIVPKNFFNRQLNIGNKPSGSIASDGRLYINRDMLNICMQLIDVRPPPPPQLSSPEYCFAAKDMIICYNNTNDAELIYDLGAAGYINRVGINPATNVNILDESLIPVGKSVYTPPVQQSIYNGVQKSAGGVRKVVWR